MTHAEHLEQVRDLVRSQLAELGVNLQQLQETILIRDGLYCGRRFRVDAVHAVWFFEENELKIYDAEGGVARVIRPLHSTRDGHRRVA